MCVKPPFDSACLGNIAESGGEIQKSGLVFDDVLIEAFHVNSPWAWCLTADNRQNCGVIYGWN